jgi:phosphomevalonate kinase
MVFKLSCIAHFLGQGKIGSAFDVAASTFGGALIYKRFDAKWLEQEMKSKKISEVVDEQWPHLYFEQLKLPKDFGVVVGFSGKSASTKELVGKINEFKQRDNAQYQGIMQELKETTEQLISALKIGNKEQVLALIRQNRGILKDFSDSSMNELETPELRKIIETAEQNKAAGKFSGAGGGDCAIAVCFSKDVAEAVKKAIKQKDLFPLDVRVSKGGVLVVL